MTAAFIRQRAEQLIRLKALAADKADAVIARYMVLLAHPAERDEHIMVDVIGYLSERYADETGDDEAALKYAETLSGFCAQTWEAIMAVPLPRRGSVHETGAAMVSEVCDHQALMEIVAVDALEIGDKMGVENASAAKRMSTSEKKTMARSGGLKETIGQMAADEKKAAADA